MSKSKEKSKFEETDEPRRKKKASNKEISRRAHKIYLERLKSDISGDDESDWLQAEEELNEGI